MGKLPRKEKSVEETVELDMLADTIEDEIIDLLATAEETAPAPDDVPIGAEAFAGTLDAELLGVSVGESTGTLSHKNEEDLDFEESLMEMFETTELLAADLLGESSQTEEEEKEQSFRRDESPSDEVDANLGLAAEASDERGGPEEVLESQGELPDNLFINIERAKKAPAHRDGATTVDTKPEAISDKINWIDSSRYYPSAVQDIDRKISEHKQEIEKLVAEREQLKKIYRHVRSILYLEGEELRKAILLILGKYWSLKLFFLNKPKGVGFNENILIRYDGRKILAKIMSTSSVSPSHKLIAQMWQDLHYSGLGARADGALIVNYNTKTDPKDRSLAYADENEEQLDDLIFIDTRVLYKLTAAIIDGHLPVEEAKKILFKKGRVEFHSADLAF